MVRPISPLACSAESLWPATCTSIQQKYQSLLQGVDVEVPNVTCHQSPWYEWKGRKWPWQRNHKNLTTSFMNRKNTRTTDSGRFGCRRINPKILWKQESPVSQFEHWECPSALSYHLDAISKEAELLTVQVIKTSEEKKYILESNPTKYAELFYLKMAHVRAVSRLHAREKLFLTVQQLSLSGYSY